MLKRVTLLSVLTVMIYILLAGCGGEGATNVVPIDLDDPGDPNSPTLKWTIFTNHPNGVSEFSPTSGSQTGTTTVTENLDGNGSCTVDLFKNTEYVINVFASETDHTENKVTDSSIIKTGTTDGSSTIGDGVPTPTPTQEPTPGPGQPTWTPSPTPQNTPGPGQPTWTPSPTSTPVPTATWTPSPTATTPPTDPVPEVTSILPQGGPEGAEVAIVGSELTGCSVKINGVDQSSGFITQTDVLISFNIVVGTYAFGQGFTTIVIENAGGQVSDDFVVYKYRDDISKDATGWGIQDLVFDTTGTKIFASDASWDVIREISFPGLTENNTSGISGGGGYIDLHPGNSRLYVPAGTTACYYPTDLSGSATFFPGAPFSGQGNGVAYNPILSDKIFIVDDNGGSASTVKQFDLDGSNPSTKINLSIWPDDMATDEDGNFYVASSENSKIAKYTSSGTYVTEWEQRHSTRLCCTKINGKTAVFSNGDTGTGNAIESIFLVDETQSTRMCDIVIIAGQGAAGVDFYNNYLVYFLLPSRRFEVFSF